MFVKKCEENVAEVAISMDALTKVCEIFLIYCRKILCEKLNRLSAVISAFYNKDKDLFIILK